MNVNIRAMLVLPTVLLAMALAAPSVLARQSRLPAQLPAGALDVLNAASGVEFSGSEGSKPDLQLVCDANCPYCAKLYVDIQDRFPEVVVRWVPVAYFKPDSASLAARILSSGDPVASLARNYRAYDFTDRRGGYRPADGQRAMLAYENEVLKRHWREWGGFTPMILAPDGKGQVYLARDTTPSSIRSLLEAARGEADR